MRSETIFKSPLRAKLARGGLWFALACLPAALPLGAGLSVSHHGFNHFAPGEFENVSLHRDGRLTLAPGVTEIGRLAESVIWSAVAAPDGSVYLGAGTEGNVYRLDPEGELEALFTTEEVLTRAMAVDSAGRLYVGSSPDGKVYRYLGDGELEEYFDPGETYIWAMLFDENDDLFVATGDKGRIYRVAADRDPEAEKEIFFEGEESHISTLAWDRDGTLLAGTSPNGYVYRIQGPDDVFVFFNSPDEEIRQIVATDTGDLYVATFSSAAEQSGGRGAAIAQAVAALSSNGDASGGESSSSNRGSSSGNNARPSTLYRVDADGFFETFWGLPGVAIHSLLLAEDGALLIGTGDDGRIFSLTGFQSWRLRQTLPAGSRVSELLRRPGSTDVLAFSSNPARVYSLDFGLSESGQYTSEVFDATQVARWGRIYTETSKAGGNGVKTFVRSGNTEKANRTWSAWREVDFDGDGEGITPASRYFQYRLTFGEPRSEVRGVRFFYRHANAAPVIQSLRVVTADLGLERFEMPPQAPTIDLEQLARESGRRGIPVAEPRQQIRGIEQPGMITLVWRARDPNNDELRYTVRLRPAGAVAWDTIATGLRHSFYSFNGNGLPDGEYQVKVIASDHLSNRPGEAREARRVSENFVVDNTAPEIRVEEVSVNGSSATIRFLAADQTSILESASFALNGEEPVLLYPEDGLFDAREERFKVNLNRLPAGRHAVLLRVTDEAGKVRVHQIAVEVEQGR